MATSFEEQYISQLTAHARQLNAFADNLKTQRSSGQRPQKTLREVAAGYGANLPDDFPATLFDDSDLEWLQG